jgi:cyclophilin family peptidyl-prolyl cis-trans isomerase/HEAT repeat protein
VQEALAWAGYRLGLRGLGDSTVTVKEVSLLSSEKTHQTRLGAANYFARGGAQLNFVEAQLIAAAQHDPSSWVRAGVTSGLRRIKTETSQKALLEILKTDTDYRVRISAVRALQNFPIEKTKAALFTALNDSNINVAIATAEALRSIATKEIAGELVQQANASKNWRVKATLYEAALAASATVALTDEVKNAFTAEQNVYGKAALLTALGKSVTAWGFINDQLQQTTIPVIRSSAAMALVDINQNATFDRSIQQDFIAVYKKAIETGDAAVIGTIAGALMEPALNYKSVITDYTFLYEAKKKLSLPKDNEALQPLEAAIAYFEGKDAAPPVKNEFNHPIDWEFVKTIPANQKVLIKTSKGDIVLRLLVEEAPGSVANFVQLLQANYFNAKNFHRVVPNFVIQGGCNRGDGWGSEDYSIRSEFSARHYTEGSVGMASAGKDTEGTQWFITHSPTPHLDGRYTIFAVTESGMNVVHQMEVGDQIVSVTLLD